MTGAPYGPDHPASSAVARWRRKQARRRMYLRRRIVAALILIALVAGIYFGLNWLVSRLFGETPEPTPSADGGTPNPPAAAAVDPSPLPFAPQSFLEAGDLNGDGTSERVAVGPVTDHFRPVALVTGPEEEPSLIGEPVTVPDFPLAIGDLPRAGQVLILEGRLPRSGEPRTVAIPGGEALLASGGEPAYRVWRLDADRGLVEADYYALAAPLTPPAPTAIVVDKYLNALWYYEEGQLRLTARVATGQHIEGPAPSHANRMENFLTPLGRFTIASKQENPPYYPGGIAGGDPENPLGTRWLGFAVYEGDPGNVWGIHGTNDPAGIGRWASRGGIAMRNEDVEQLYEWVEVGTLLEIRGAAHP